MNSVKAFLDLLEDKKTKNAWDEMTVVLKEHHQYFQNIPASERGLVVNVLFNKRTGVLTFLNNTIHCNDIIRSLAQAMIEVFNLLTFVMNEFSDVYSEKHVKTTQAVCTDLLTMKASFYLKLAANRTLLVLIKTFASLGLDFNDIINSWVSKFRLYSDIDRRLLLEVVAAVSKYFPQTPVFARDAKAIRGQLVADIALMRDGTKSKITCGMVTYVEAINNILYNFPPSKEDIGKISGPDKLYKIFKDLCSSNESVSNKMLMAAVINLFAEHLVLFDEFVYEDHEFWHNFFKSFVRRQLPGDASIKALRLYYKTMGAVLGRKQSENDKKIFLNLRDTFQRSLSDANLSLMDLRLTVYGCSQIIKPCKNYFAEAGVEEVFSLIVHCTIPRYAREDDEAASIEEIADIQEALSTIIRHMSNVTIDQIRPLTTLCLLLIKRYPELATAEQENAVSSLNRTIVNVRYTKDILYQDFISHIIFDGIVWSCSHMLLIDAELDHDVEEPSQHRPITYKNYTFLWQGLLNPANYSFSQSSEARAVALQSIVDETITTCITLINTLNLKLKPKEDNVFSDVKASQTVENESDFRIFLNLVDLCVEILPNIESFLWMNTIQKFLYEIIKNSYKNPLISGFYKLANVVTTSSEIFAPTDLRDISDETFSLVLRYLTKTIDSVAQFPPELQISCLELILNAPEVFVKRIVNRAACAFKIAFSIGLANYELATVALDALERWTKLLGSDCPKDFVGELIPCLEKFLQSEETSIQLIHDIEEIKRRTVKKVTLLDDDFSVERFQKRILLFFGSLESDVMLQYIHSKSLKTGARWNKKDLLKYSLPFPDVNLEMNLDGMLPRIVELALNSGDCRTRVNASEVLHTIVAVVLGKTAQSLAFDKDRFTPLYEIICPALLKLGSDSDRVIAQLYTPLMMQMTHWLSSRHLLDSRATVIFVDSLFEGLCDETNSSLRESSGIYLAEFVRWSIKQSSDRDLALYPVNINLIVQRIINFALDPSTNKRVAAAIVFNHLYRILRENEEIVNVFWLEILQAFVRSLDGCDDPRIREALRHVERVLVEKPEIFNRESSRRIRPPGFIGVKLEDAAKWIFERCGSLDRGCRKNCLKLLEGVSKAVEGFGDARRMIDGYIKSEGMKGFNEILLGNLDQRFRAGSAEDLEKLLRTFDLYVWMLNGKLVEKEMLFSEANCRRNVVFEAIETLVKELLKADVMVENPVAFSQQELVRLKSLRCEIVLALFDFVPVLLNAKANDENLIPDYVFSVNLFRLVSMCLVRPHVMGFDSSNLELTEELPRKLEVLLKSASGNLGQELTERMRNVLASDIQRFSKKLFQFDEILSGTPSVSKKSLKGLILLHKCHLLKLCSNCLEITANAPGKITQMFETLSTEELGQNVCYDLKLETKVHFQHLIELLLLEYDTETMKTVIKLLTDTATLYRSDLTTTLTHGEYFLSVFKDVLIRSCLRDLEKTLNLLENSISQNPDNVLRIVEALVLYLQRHKTAYQTELDRSADLVMKKFSAFERAVNNLDHRRNVFLNIFAVVVRLKKRPLDVFAQNSDLCLWILKELVECNKFMYKIRLLRDFLICLTDEHSGDNPQLTVILYSLKNERRISENAPGEKIAATETLICFQNLLKLLPITKSSVVFDAVMNFAQGAGKLLCEDKVSEYLKLYFSSISSAKVLKSLELAYKRFMNANDTEDRFDVLSYFLLPSFGLCSFETLENFFGRNIRDIYSIIVQEPTKILHDRQQLFLSKIGCYNLVAIMFANLPKNLLDSKESPLAINPEKKLSKLMYCSTLPIRQLKALEGDDLEIFRRMQCAAYNCSIAIVSMTEDERFYVAVFGEHREKHQLIWENIVDINRQYKLQQISKEYPKKRKMLLNIRKSEREEKISDNYSYIKSYDLATSTLSDNICAYDLNACNLAPIEASQEREAMSLTLEVDDFNEHECMASICGLLNHMLRNQTSPSTDSGVVKKIPKWMSCFCNSMSSKHLNIRLFLLKIVLNTQAVFKPYAEFFLEPIISTVYHSLKCSPLNYVLTDALLMLHDWRQVSVPTSDKCKNLARLMFALLVEKGTAAPTKYIVKYNVSIIEMITNAWHESLNVPENLTVKMSKMDRLAVRLILVFLTNRMEDAIVNRDDVWEYLEKCLADWKIEEETVLQGFEAVGLMLRHLQSGEGFEEHKTKIVEIARNAFRSMYKQNPGRLVKCAHALCKAFPELSEEFYQSISSSQQRVEHNHVAKCLEVFSLMIPKLSSEDIVKQMSYMKFNALLENKVLSCVKICLSIIAQVVPILEPRDLLPIIRLITPYADHEVLDYRRICCEASARLYERFSNDESTMPEVCEIMETSRQILLQGLMDPTEEIQKLSTAFWSDSPRIRSKVAERLLDVLDSYAPGVEKNFLQIMTLMLLQLTKKSANYEEKMFEPLHNCSYYDHNISITWKRRNLESRIPLFARSVASQLNHRFTQLSYAMGSSTYAEELQEGLMLRATQAPQFEATFLGEPSLPGNFSEEGTFAVPKVPEVTKNKVSRRFVANWSEVKSNLERNQAAMKFMEKEDQREFQARQRSSVKLYRKYRIGDFPDIEISHAMLLGPLQQLVKKDPMICKSLIVSLVRLLVDKMNASGEGDHYCRELSVKLTNILRKRQGNGAVIPAVFEILFNVSEIDFPWEIFTKVAKTSGLYSQGALLAERSLIYENESSEPPVKRRRAESLLQNEDTDHWIELADLYESMNEVDVVLSIFRGETFSDDLHSASVARAASNYEKAEHQYRKALKTETSPQVRRHCLEGMFDCMSRLSKWKQLENVIDSKVEINLQTLLDGDDVLDERWAAPWVFRSHTQRILEGRPNEDFVNTFQSYLDDTTKRQRLMDLFGEESAVITINDYPDISRDFLKASCEKIREEWIQLSPLAVPLRSAMLLRLQGIRDIDCYLRMIEGSDIAESSRSLLNSWQNNGPMIGDDLLAWDKHLSYRSYFTSCLIEKLNGSDSQESEEIIKRLKSVKVEKTLKLVAYALNQRNDHVAKKYLRNIQSDSENCEDQALIDKFELYAIRCKFLNAEMSPDPKKSLKYYAISWEKAHELLDGKDLSISFQIAIRQIISTMATSFANMATNQPDIFATLSAESNIVQRIFTERIDFDNVADTLNHYNFTNLKKCCEVAPEIGECHLQLSKYCYERISMGSECSEICREFVRSTLKAMSCGSEEATHYFPCLLKEELLADEEMRDVFIVESSGVETWRFLVWQAQLLSHLGTPICNLVLPIVQNMAKEYPNALSYSLRLILDTKPQLRNDPNVLSLTDLLVDRKEFNRFLEAMQYVVQPELYLEYHLKELVRNLSQGRATVVDALVKKVYPMDVNDGCSIQGREYKAIARYRKEIEKIVEMPVENVEKHVVQLLVRLRQSAKKGTNQMKLRDYSPWLHEFDGRDIEVPGQYTGERKPVPKYHARIVKVESAVKVMRSKRKPIRITIVANNAKTYRFLVKFGEDLRLDQRVEQVFDVMNKTLKTDVVCSQRRLSVGTYQVFPLSGCLGFIQWVDGTKTLNDYIFFSLDESKRNQLLRIQKEYEEWVAKAAPGKGSPSQYKEAMLKYTSEDVLAWMTDIGEKIGWDLLKRTFLLLSPSMEAFMSLRQGFTTSYATMCLTQWILGIGDRHLGNTLIDIESGRSLAIDFGSAFGGAVDQPVPELMPFRLTPQIRGLLKPFNESDLLGATMTHVLRALRKGKGPLLACLSIVVCEQLNWEEHVNKLSQEMQSEPVDIKWLPGKKVAVVFKKLNGGKPSSITLEQLKERHSDEDYFYRYVAVVNGIDSDDKSKRSLLKEDNLSPEQQVQCLIEQATDLNVLGRTYAGWTPWL